MTTEAMIRTLTARVARASFAALFAVWAVAAGAQEFPSKPLRFVVGFPAGAGSSDVSARAIAPALAERLKQQVIVDNTAGAGGMVGVTAVAKSAPDGHTIGFGPFGALATSVSLRSQLPYHPLDDLAPVTLAMTLPQVLVAAADTPIGSVADLIALAKAKPGQLAYGSSGTGTTQHLAGAMLAQMAGIELLHVPYKGSQQAVLDLIGGRIPLAVIDLASARPLMREGRIRVLGLTSGKRTALAPEIPTLAESGVPGLDVVAWFGIIAPAGTPPATITRLNSELVAVLDSPDVRSKLMTAGIEPLSSSPQEFGALIRSDIEKYGKLIKAMNIKVE